MKNVLKSVLLFLVVFGTLNAQNVNTDVENNTIKYGDVSLEITVDSLEEIDSVFQLNDLRALIAQSDQDENISFKIICNGDTNTSGKKNHISYKVFGNSNEPDKFMASVKKILESAKNYYKNN